MLAMPREQMPTAAAVACVAAAWSGCHLTCAASRCRPGLLFAADLTLVSGLCLSQGITVPETEDLHGNTWILVAVSIIVVTYQLTHRPVFAALAALLLFTADLVGLVVDHPGTWTSALPQLGWLLVQAALARLLYQLVLRRSRAADRAASAAAEARRRHEVAQARRRAEGEYLATLHDTACATLMMAAARGSSIDADVLRRQAASDLERLASMGHLTGEVELATELRAEARQHPVTVDTRLADALGSVSRPVAAALRGGLGEALRNVSRHAGVTSARLTAERDRGTVVVTLSDEGVGFDPARLPRQSRGVERSIVERMTAVGGIATVTSRPGRGTCVRLEWPCVRLPD
nr:ATP-binding protein [Streptomyces zhaozhouensis]